MSNTYYLLRGYDKSRQEKFWVGPFINNSANTPKKYTGSIIRSNEYSDYYEPNKSYLFELLFFKTNKKQEQLNKYDIIRNEKLTLVNNFSGSLDLENSLYFESNNIQYKLRFNIKEEPGTSNKLIMHPELTIEFEFEN